MRRAINTSVRVFTEAFDVSGPVVELGSLYLEGWEEIGDLRRYFTGLEYLGCDLRSGLGVDRIEDAQDLSFEDESVGTFLMFETLEHLPYPEQALAEAYRVLGRDGLLALSVPFHYRLHAFPDDYWRFTASGVYRMLDAFPHKVVFALGPQSTPAFVFAVAGKEATIEFEARRATFERSIDATFSQTRLRAHVSVLKGVGRELFGCVFGRARLGACFFDPEAEGGYFPRA